MSVKHFLKKKERKAEGGGGEKKKRKTRLKHPPVSDSEEYTLMPVKLPNWFRPLVFFFYLKAFGFFFRSSIVWGPFEFQRCWLHHFAWLPAGLPLPPELRVDHLRSGAQSEDYPQLQSSLWNRETRLQVRAPLCPPPKPWMINFSYPRNFSFFIFLL